LSDTNRLVLVGRIAGIDALRYTPAGVAIVRFVLEHASEQAEAGSPRKVNLEMTCVATETTARLVAATPLGTTVRVSGFVAAKSKTRRALELHAVSIELQ
jgi:primosomal replication protein N